MKLIVLFVCISCARRGDYAIIAAQMHEGEQAEKTVVVCVEIAVVVWLVTRVPQTFGKLAAALVGSGQRYCGGCMTST